MTLLGAILAGGQSRRFGSDKALARLDGRQLIDHAAALLVPHVDAVVICGRTAHPGAAVCIADFPQPDLGPLGGLCAALLYARQQEHDAVLTIGCDTPVLPPDLLPRLATARLRHYVEEMPIIGYWPVVLADDLALHLAAAGDRSMRRWAQSAGSAAMNAGCPIPNLNSPADLALLRESIR